MSRSLFHSAGVVCGPFAINSVSHCLVEQVRIDEQAAELGAKTVEVTRLSLKAAKLKKKLRLSLKEAEMEKLLGTISTSSSESGEHEA